jgi:Putative adhesin
MAEHRFQTPEPVELDVRIPAGDIDVETIDGVESTVIVEGSDRLVEATRVELRGRTLLVEHRPENRFGLSFSIGDFHIGSDRLRIRAAVPHASDVVVSTASADTKLRGRFASLETKTASGDVVLVGEIEGPATLKTVSGDTRLPHVGGDVQANSVSGDLSLGTIGGSIEVRSVSGDLRVESAREGRVTVQSVSGDVELGVAPGTNLDVDAGTVSGDLASEVPLGDDAGAAAPEGPTLVVRGKTVSGDFQIFRAA